MEFVFYQGAYMKLKLLVGLMCLGLGSQAFAGLLIDPYVGIGQAKTTFDIGSNDTDESGSSQSIGSRLGYSFILLSAGVDFEMAKSDSDGDDVTLTNTSLFVGVDLPILLRFWGEYFINSSFDLDGSDADFEFKDGYGLGVGFTGLPFVSINLEVSALNYDIELGPAEGDFTVGHTLLSVSLPLDL